MTAVKLAVSILSADFARLGEQIAEAEEGGADWVHVDVMDGRFVPPLSLGPGICAAARRSTGLPLDVHLMVEAPENHITAFADAGADLISVHWEATRHLHRVVEQVRQRGLRAGVALNPATPASLLDEILPMLDLVLIMSVNPGWGGQPYITGTTRKVEELCHRLRAGDHSTLEVEVDGGIDTTTAGQVVRAGASVLVAGSAVFNNRGSVADNLAGLRQASRA